MDDDFYAKMNLFAALESFPVIRAEFCKMLRGYDREFWTRVGTHDAFEPYSTTVLLGHCLNADYSHFFSIEQLGLTKESHLSEILTLP